MVKGSVGGRPTTSSTAVLGRGLRVVGRVRSVGDLRIEADIEGDVSIDGTLEIDEPARVVGSIEAAALVVAGQVEGDVTATRSVSIAQTGTIRGTVRAPSVSMDEGGTLDGLIEADFEMPGGLA